MKVKVFLDDQTEPIQIINPPDRFSFDSTNVADGKHTLRFCAIEEGGKISERIINFSVRNGPAITVHGVVEGDTVSGNVDIVTNAYGSKHYDVFEPVRMESPVPIPIWAWVLFLIIFAWGAGYATLTYYERDYKIDLESTAENSSQANSTTEDWAVLGEQVYGNNCSSCHQANGAGLPNVFPPLSKNSVVLNDDPTEHINSIIHGLSGKIIDGVEYASPMPPFGAVLNDEEISAVVNHERTSWGNQSKLVTPAVISSLR